MRSRPVREEERPRELHLPVPKPHLLLPAPGLDAFDSSKCEPADLPFLLERPAERISLDPSGEHHRRRVPDHPNRDLWRLECDLRERDALNAEPLRVERSTPRSRVLLQPHRDREGVRRLAPCSCPC